MTEKEFRKLRRRDLLQLLVAQGKENIQLQEELDETKGELAQSQESNDRLKAKLDEKDALIEKLKGRLDEKDAVTEGEKAQSQKSSDRLKAKLDEKDALIEKLKGRLDEKDAKIHQLREEMAELRVSRRIELEKSGSIAEAALKLNGVFEAAQRAADQYLDNIREKYGGVPMGPATEPMEFEEPSMESEEDVTENEEHEESKG